MFFFNKVFLQKSPFHTVPEFRGGTINGTERHRTDNLVSNRGKFTKITISPNSTTTTKKFTKQWKMLRKIIMDFNLPHLYFRISILAHSYTSRKFILKLYVTVFRRFWNLCIKTVKREEFTKLNISIWIVTFFLFDSRQVLDMTISSQHDIYIISWHSCWCRLVLKNRDQQVSI